MPCIFQSFLLSSSNNESVFLPIYKPDIREAIKCHLPHLVSEPLCGTLTIELKNGGGGLRVCFVWLFTCFCSVCPPCLSQCFFGGALRSLWPLE